jgi:hypothetical protein
MRVRCVWASGSKRVCGRIVGEYVVYLCESGVCVGVCVSLRVAGGYPAPRDCSPPKSLSKWSGQAQRPS